MAYSINGKLKVAVSSRALFQLEKEDEIFLKKGKEAYERYQVKHEKDVLLKLSWNLEKMTLKSL